MNRLSIPAPLSAGILLSYKCTSACRHCLYACSPRWKADWLTLDDAETILTQLAATMRSTYGYPGRVGINEGLHFTGGEPFLHFDLLLEVTALARRLGIRGTFVETNCFWCTDDAKTREKLIRLKEAGLDGILISVNPFIIEQVPFERIQYAVRISAEVFPGNVMMYQRFFYEQFRQMGLKGTLPFEEYLQRGGYGLHYAELLPGGRVSYALAHLFQKYPAQHFFSSSCRHELVRDWHVHVDNYGNYVPGYCGGLSLGDARDLNALLRGINLDELPVLHALLTSLEELYRLGKTYGYEERDGYVSKCHLCTDIRRYLARVGDFQELKPREFYEHLED
nr:radical SAM protein [Chloroflexota bacterium]